jgi:hypothetical protein
VGFLCLYYCTLVLRHLKPFDQNLYIKSSIFGSKFLIRVDMENYLIVILILVIISCN